VSEFLRVACLDDVWSGEMIVVAVRGVRVLLVNVEGQVHAYEDRCAHQGMSLVKGSLEGRTLTCSAHGWEYDACTGCGINPERTQLRTFPVKVVRDEVYVDVDARAGEAQA
jgi:toluene monooxygenase system ferredoxin subunit